MPNILPPKLQRLDKVRADFFVDGFKQLLAQKGLRLLWEQRQPCPCFISTAEFSFDLNGIDDVNSDVNGNPDCAFCGGGGLITHSQQEIKGIPSSVNSDYDSNDFGTVLLPETLITLLPEHIPSFGDRFTFMDSAMTRSEILHMSDAVQTGATKNLALSFPASVRTLELQAGNIEKSILSVYYTDDNGNVVGELPEFDANGNRLWDLNENTNSLRLFGSSPPINVPSASAKVSVTYYAKPTFTVFGQPFAIRDTFLREKGVEIATPMPVQAYAKLEKK